MKEEIAKHVAHMRRSDKLIRNLNGKRRDLSGNLGMQVGLVLN
jgi:hypothetical protein